MTGDDQIILALIGVGTTLIAALVATVKAAMSSRVAAVQAAEANRAVNGVGPGEARLYDMVADIKADLDKLVVANEDFARRGWMTLPDDLSTAARLTETIRALQHGSRDTSEKLDQVLKTIRAHDEWERQQKHKGE